MRVSWNGEWSVGRESGADWSRIAGLEMLDEVEELELVLEHYGVTWGLLGEESAWGRGEGRGQRED